MGISYEAPDNESIPDFANYFATYAKHLKLRSHQTLHFELDYWGEFMIGYYNKSVILTLLSLQISETQSNISALSVYRPEIATI